VEGRSSLKRTIIHVDMDAFYASIEQRDNPEFRGKPVVVGADPKGGRGRGVVSAASYEAREYGIHSAQPISQAFRLCPHAIFLPVRVKRYRSVSLRIMKIFREYTPIVEPVSLDEAFLDMTGTTRLYGSPERVGKKIKQRIYQQEGLTASVGIGPNKLTAKIASEIGKPNGFMVIEENKIRQILDPLPVKRLWGIGPKTEEKLISMGIYTIGGLATLSKETLKGIFGNMGVELWNMANGIDDTPVIPLRECKSVSNEVTFGSDQTETAVLHSTILSLSEKVGYRLRKKKMHGRTVVLKVRLSDFSTLIRHSSLARPTFLSEKIYEEALSIFHRLDLKNQAVRLIGVGITNLESIDFQQMELFDGEDERRIKLSAVIDMLRDKFGERIIGRGNRLR